MFGWLPKNFFNKQRVVIFGGFLLCFFLALSVQFLLLEKNNFVLGCFVTTTAFLFTAAGYLIHYFRVENYRDFRRHAISNMAEGYLLCDAQGKITEFNESALSILGRNGDEIFGMSIMDPDWKYLREDGDKIKVENHPCYLALHMGQKQMDKVMGVGSTTSEVRWVRLSAVPLFNSPKAKKTSGVVITFTDISETFKLERKLADSILQLNQMLEGSQIGSWDWNPKTNEANFDRMFCSLMGYDYFDTNHSYELWKSRVHLEDLSSVEQSFSDLIAGKESAVSRTYRILHNAGHWIWVMERGFPSEVDGDGKILMIKRVVQNITHLKVLEESLRQQSEKYRENIDELFQTRVRLSQVLDSSPTAVYEATLNNGGRFINFISRYIEEITGYEDVSFTRDGGVRFDSMIHPEDIRQVHECFECAMGAGQSFDIRYRIVSKSGDIRWVWDKGIASGPKGENLVGALVDVTDQTKLSFELSSAVQRLQLAASAVQLGLWDWDIRTDTLFWDPSLYKTFGLKKENFQSDRDALEKSFHPQDWARYQSELKKCFAERREQFNIEYRILDGGLKIRQVASAAICTYSEDGQPLRMVGNNWDVTEEREAQTRIVEMSAWQRSILDSSPFAVISTSVDGTVSTFNRAAEKMLRYASEEVVGNFSLLNFCDLKELKERFKDSFDFVENDFKSSFIPFVRRTMNLGRDIQEWNYVCSDGSLVPVRLIMSPILDGKGALIGFLGVAEDLTEQRKMKRVIETQQAQMLANAKMSSLGEMAGGVAHEINNPLAVIRGRASQLLRSTNSGQFDPAQFKKTLEGIIQTSDRIAKIVKGLKTFSRGASDDPFEPTNVRTLVDETIEMCAERFRISGVQLVVGGCPDYEFEARATQISQVLLNLLSNAFDAVEKLEERWVIVDVVVTMEEWVVIRVTDSGKGIPAEVANRIMEPFFTTKEVGKGTGLGLSISRGIVEEHGGKLVIDKNPQGNTCFKIELPRKRKTQVAA